MEYIMALKSMNQFLSHHPDFDKVSESFRNRRFPALARLSSAIFLTLQTPEAINNFANASPEQKQRISAVLALDKTEQDLAFHYAGEYAQYVQDYNNRKNHGLLGFFKKLSEKISNYPKSPYEQYLKNYSQKQPATQPPKNTDSSHNR